MSEEDITSDQWDVAIRSHTIRADRITSETIQVPITRGDRVSSIEVYGEGRQPYDVALDNAAKKLLERIEGAGLEPDMPTLEVVRDYDPNFARDRVIVTVVAK